MNPVNADVSSPYGPRGNKFHAGTDYLAEMGTPVVSVWPGKVAAVGDFGGGYGTEVIIQHFWPYPFFTQYAHLYSTQVQRGQWVNRGTQIGNSGNSGHSQGPHLHFEVRRGLELSFSGNENNTYNPEKVLKWLDILSIVSKLIIVAIVVLLVYFCYKLLT